MQLFKHMEVVLMFVFGIVCAAVAFTPAGVPHRIVASAPAAAAFSDTIAPSASSMPTVHVIGRRLAPSATGPSPVQAAVIATPKNAWAMEAD